jgi:hypothetical protein
MNPNQPKPSKAQQARRQASQASKRDPPNVCTYTNLQPPNFPPPRRFVFELDTMPGYTQNYDAMHFLKGALSGGICCAVTHGALTPVDVVKTRMQLDPVKYNGGMVKGFQQVIKGEGAGALLTGLGPTVVGYFVQVSLLGYRGSYFDYS